MKERVVRQRRPWILVALAILIVVVAGSLATAYPTVAAVACPGCYGMTSLRPGVYVEDSLPATQRHTVSQALDEANQKVSAFYGERSISPRILVCTTAHCYHRIGGGNERGVAVLNRALILSPLGANPVIASHELSHVELHHRLRSGADPVPQWFDEGLAVLVSDDPRYLLPATATDRCRVEPGMALPVTVDEWLRAANADGQLYARAACRVSRWADANGGDAVRTLIHRLNRGESFTAIVGS